MRATITKIYPWLVVVFLILLYTSAYIDRSIFGLLVKPVRADLGINDTQYSLLAGFAFAVLYTTSAIPLGYVVDNGSRRMLIAVAAAFWSTMTALCGLANSFTGLFVARLGVGVGQAPLSPSSYSLLSHLFPKEKLGRALSFYHLGIPFGSGLALVIGGSLVDFFAQSTWSLPFAGEMKPWQMVFVAIGVPGLLLAAATPFVIKEPPRQTNAAGQIERPGLPTVLKYIWQHRGFYGGFFTAAAFGPVAFNAFAYWMPTYLQRIHNYSASDAGLLLGTATVLLGIPGSLGAGWAADMLIGRGRRDGHLIVSGTYLVGCFVFGCIGPLIPAREPAIVMVAALGFFNVTWAGVLTAALQIMTPVRMRGQVSAIYLFVAGIIGLGLGPTLVGLATDFVFHNDAAVGKSIALVGTVALVIGLAGVEVARRNFLKETTPANT